MGQPSSIDQLPETDRQWLDRELHQRGFCGYAEVAGLLQARGYTVSKSSVHRYGQKLERKLAAVQASTQAAVLIAEAAPDDADLRSSAVLSLVQTGLFEALVDLQEAADVDAEGNPAITAADRLELLSKAGKGIAEIMKASRLNKEWQVEVREKAERAAKAVERIAKKGGLSADAVDQMRREILGIAT